LRRTVRRQLHDTQEQMSAGVLRSYGERFGQNRFGPLKPRLAVVDKIQSCAHCMNGSHIDHRLDIYRIEFQGTLDRVAALTASTALENSARNPSPVFLMMRPPCSTIAGWTALARKRGQFGVRRLLVVVHEPGIAGHIGGQYRR
jgi:hypothetical protein